MVEARQQRPNGNEDHRQENADANINPEQVARKRMADFFPLEDYLREAVQAEAAKHQAESRDHGHDSKISRCKQPSEDYDCTGLHKE